MQKLASFEINTQIDKETCFYYLSNMENFDNWFPEVIKIASENKESIGVGKRYKETVKIPVIGLKDITLTVQNYEKYSSFATEGDLSPLLPRMEILVSNGGNGNTIVNWSFYSRNSSNLFKFVAPLFKSVMNKRAQIASIKLKNVLASLGHNAGLERQGS